ncbi:hypothetical protein J2Z65_004895 [Paenibacillus aceris]|uniref:Uncharacterized protein n=1 Tax=Paenibacillus aceris TaxID=869555 RepID=A0ABS4I409_9BACL|nr:hypothetical protein [Paenibacillus aceris]
MTIQPSTLSVEITKKVSENHIILDHIELLSTMFG